RPSVPRLEVEPDRKRRPVAAVARPEGVEEAQVRLVLDRGRRFPNLVREQVVVHRDDPERVAHERDLEQRDVPDPEYATRPGPERRLPARVVPETTTREHRVEGREIPLETRRAAADDLARPERQLARVRVEEELVELGQLLAAGGTGPL